MSVTRPGARPAPDSRTLLHGLLAGGALFLAWRLGRVLGTVFWAVFGLAVALFWSGAWRALVP